MTGLRRFVARHRKAIAAAVGAGLSTGIPLVLDGHLSGSDVGAILLAVLGASGLTYAAPANTPPADAEVVER